MCRITLEKGCPTVPYGITCSVYGLMMHTTWADTHQEAMEKYEGMKQGLRECAERLGRIPLMKPSGARRSLTGGASSRLVRDGTPIALSS